MSQVIEVFMLPFDEGDCPDLDGLGTYGDIFQFLPDYESWKADPAKFGLRKSASRNSWHEVALSVGIPALRKDESPELEYLRRPENVNAFQEATPSYDIQYDDSAISFYSFILSLNECVKYCIDNQKNFLFMRGLP
jgi:hypothetical protein